MGSRNDFGLLKRTIFPSETGVAPFEEVPYSETFFGERKVVLKSMKTMGVYEVAALLISVFWFVGCSGSTQGPSFNSNSPNSSTAPSASRALSKFFYVVRSVERTAHGFAIDGATEALTAAGQAVEADDSPIFAAATPDGKFLYVANAGTKGSGVFAFRIDGLRGSLMVDRNRSEGSRSVAICDLNLRLLW